MRCPLAINALKKVKVIHQVHQYQHDPNSAFYDQEAVEKVGQNPHQVFKILVVKLDRK